MKIGVVSCYFICNYGSVLQSYATQLYLQNCGVECETIATEGLQPFLKKARRNYYLSNLYNLPLFASKAPMGKLFLMKKINCKNIGSVLEKRRNEFLRFQQCLTFDAEPAMNFDDLRKKAAQYDMVILGGDQLWRPDNIYPGYYTLDWVPDNVKKISFGTSFGVSSLNRRFEKKAKHFLNRFDALSVREKAGQRLIYELTGKKAMLACDPVFMIPVEKWETVAADSACPKGDYIFTYFLGNNKKHREFAKKLSRETGLPLVGIPHIDSYLSVDDQIDVSLPVASPEEYIGLIKNAKYVCTDSFHTSAFAILFHRDFFTFKRFSNGKAGTNSRIESLMDTLSIGERCLNDNVEVNECLNLHTDFAAVDKKLQQLTIKTDRFIKSAIFESEVTI